MSFIFRAYHAMQRSRPMSTRSGMPTAAVYVFVNMIRKLREDFSPHYFAAIFEGGKVFRDDRAKAIGSLRKWNSKTQCFEEVGYEGYKAKRESMPEDLSRQVPYIRRALDVFHIPMLQSEGFEADDVIGTLSKQASAAGYEVYMVTPDKDYGQLVDERVRIYKPPYQGGIAEILGPKEVCEKWNIKDVSQVIDILGLMGDAVDNIPGIKGVGEKTAAKLLNEYQTLENVIANADSIKGALGEKVRAGKDSAILSKKLATIITSVPVEFHEENFRLKEWNKDALNDIFNLLEFRTMSKRLLGDSSSPTYTTPENVQKDLFGNAVTPAATPAKKRGAPAANAGGQLEKLEEASTRLEAAVERGEEEGEQVPAEEGPAPHAAKTIANTPHTYKSVVGEAAIKELITTLQAHKEICFDTETTGIDANDVEIVGMSFSVTPGEAWYVPTPSDQEPAQAVIDAFRPLFDSPDITWIGQNLKYDMLVMKWYGVSPKGQLFDTMLAHYVIEPEGKRGMDQLSAQYLAYEPVHIEELIGKKGKTQGNMRDVALDKITDYAAEDADITLQLKHIFLPQIKTKEVEKVFYQVENPLVKVLTDMEYEGIKVDTGFLLEYSKELEREARQSEEKVYEQAGERFNLASPKQLGEILFERMKLDPKAKKTKTGQYATGEDVLLKLAAKHQIVDDILAFRELTKLKSTYVDALPTMINRKTGRVHTSYAQAVAVTGRLSSNNPNLQNIPIRTERGREIRKAFIPRNDEYVLLSADYSQIELRIVAAISGDPNMCAAFLEGKDIHTATAAKVFGVDEKDVTKEMRYKAKSVNFGIIYGQGAFGLADNLGISRAEAKEIIDNYKTQFSGIQKYMDNTINFARENGYVETLMGRKRWLKDINSANFTVRGFAERNAINSPIQGTAADMIKLAMIKVHEEFTRQGFRSKMLLQVHDELVFDAYKPELDIIKPIITRCMQTALPLPQDVPALAEMGSGINWLEAH